ncbi:hypothetical protein J6590_092905, partial [Homalodisca vitripennis]
LVFMTLLRAFRQTGSTDKATTGCVASWRGLSQREKRKNFRVVGNAREKMQFVDSCFAHTKQISLGVPMSIQELGGRRPCWHAWCVAEHKYPVSVPHPPK